MASTFLLDIVTPEKTVLSENVVSLQVPSVEGSLGILAGHAPLMAELGVGECAVRLPDGTQHQLVVAGGFLDVSRNKVTLLANTAEFEHEIDVDRAEASLARARELMRTMEGTDRAALNETVRRAQARLRVARGGSSNS